MIIETIKYSIIEILPMLFVGIGLIIFMYFGLKADTPKGIIWKYAIISLIGFLMIVASLCLPSKELLMVLILKGIL